MEMLQEDMSRLMEELEVVKGELQENRNDRTEEWA